MRLVQAHGLSGAGDAFVAVSLAGTVFFSEDPHTARERVALSLVLTMAPFGIVAPFLGPMIDKMRGGRRLVLTASAGLRALGSLLMAMSLNEITLYPLAFLSLVLSKTHAVAKSAAVPEIVEGETSLVKANSVLALTAVGGGAVGGLVAILIAFVGGPVWTLRVGAVVFAMCLVAALDVGTKNAHPSKTNAMDTAAELQSSGVLNAALVMGMIRMCVGFLTFLIAFDLRRSDAPKWMFAIAVSASMLGSLLGNILGPRLRKWSREEWMLVASAFIVTIVSVVLATQTGDSTRFGGALLAFVVAIGAATGKLGFDSLVQRDARSAIQGRSFARFEAAFQLAWVVGALVPVLIDVSNVIGYIMLGLISGVPALWFVVSYHRPQLKQPNV